MNDGVAGVDLPSDDVETLGRLALLLLVLNWYSEDVEENGIELFNVELEVLDEVLAGPG